MNLATDIWAKVLELMQPDMTTTTIHTWFDDATAVALEEDRFVLYSPTRFKRDIIATRYVPFIQKALHELFSTDFDVADKLYFEPLTPEDVNNILVYEGADEVIAIRERLESRGINYLLNVGPDYLGRIPAPAVDILRQVGKKSK